MTGLSSVGFRTGLMAGIAASAVVTADVSRAQTKTFDIPAQQAATGVVSFARQADAQLLISASAARDRRTNAVRGAYAVPGALKLLLRNTGLTAQSMGANTWTVVALPETGEMRAADGAGPQRAGFNEAAAGVTLVALEPHPAAAPKLSPGPQLEEIVVTARRVEENAMKVPIAIAVMNEAAIKASGVRDIRDLSQFTPGLFSATQAATARSGRNSLRLIFRGLSTSSGTIFIDGAPYTGSGSPDVSNVERVEVLKGPQSVYFGRSTFSGAVNYVTRVPGNTFRGAVNAEAFTYGGHIFSGSVEGPIVEDKLTFRVNARRYSSGGQYKSGVTGRKLASESTTSGSVALASRPTENLKVSTYLSYSLDDDGPNVGRSIRAVGPGPTFNCNLGGTFGAYYCGKVPSRSAFDPSTLGNNDTVTPLIRSELFNNVRGTSVPFSTTWLDHFGLKREVLHGHLRADLSTDSGWQVSAIASYSRTKTASLQALEGRDTSQSPNPYAPTPAARATACAAPAGSAANAPCYAPDTLQINTYSQNLVNNASAEMRVSSPQDKRLRATVGASYFAAYGPLSAAPGIQNTGRLINGGGGGIKSRVSTPAIFGGLYFDVTDRLKISAEARYQWDDIGQQQLFPAVSGKLETTFRSFAPRLTVDYNITENSMIYGSLSRGYRPGGFNPVLLGLSESARAQLATLGSNIAYDEEEIDNLEVGSKASWFNNRLRTTIAVYSMTYKNGQIANSQFFVNPNGSAGAASVITNVGRVTLRGTELQADYAATDDLTISGSLAYADNKIKRYIYSPGGLRIWNSTNVIGNQLDSSPKLTFSLSPSYVHEVATGLNLTARADLTYRSKIYVDPTNVAWIGPRFLVNIRAGIVKDRNLRVEAYVNNVFDDDTMVGGVGTVDSLNFRAPNGQITFAPSIGSSNLNAISLGLPEKRTFGLRTSYEF